MKGLELHFVHGGRSPVRLGHEERLVVLLPSARAIVSVLPLLVAFSRRSGGPIDLVIQGDTYPGASATIRTVLYWYICDLHLTVAASYEEALASVGDAIRYSSTVLVGPAESKSSDLHALVPRDALCSILFYSLGGLEAKDDRRAVRAFLTTAEQSVVRKVVSDLQARVHGMGTVKDPSSVRLSF